MIDNSFNKEVVADAMAQLRDANPGLTDKQILESIIAAEVYGTLPKWSNLAHPYITDVGTFMAGSSVTCVFTEPEDGEVYVALALSGKHYEGEPMLRGTGGGFAEVVTIPDQEDEEPLYRETPAENAVRELREEVVDDEGKPVLDIAPDRLTIFEADTDHRAVRTGRNRHPVACSAFMVALTQKEAVTLKTHAARLQSDPAYKEACSEASHGETSDIIIMKLRDVAQLPYARFMNPHEFTAIRNLAKAMLEPQALTPGYLSLTVQKPL